MNDLRVWAVYDLVISRIEFLSENQSECRKMSKTLERAGRSVRLLRFDLSPLYRDFPNGADGKVRWVSQNKTENTTAKER